MNITKASARIALACAIALASSGAALAHAALHHASPEAGSTADVTDSSGMRLKTLSAGSYRVHWRAVSVDTHRSEGSFTFSVSGQ